jgi:hypothetical protein
VKLAREPERRTCAKGSKERIQRRAILTTKHRNSIGSLGKHVNSSRVTGSWSSGLDSDSSIGIVSS